MPCPVPPEVNEEYRQELTALLDIAPPTDANGKPLLHNLKLSSEAHAIWKAFQRKIEPMLRKGGKLATRGGYGSKLRGNVARIAGLLHCSMYKADAVHVLEIGATAMRRAVELGDIFLNHALAVFQLAAAQADLDIAKRPWEVIQRRRRHTFTANEALHPLRGAYARTLDVQGVFAVLPDHNFIIELEGKPGRPSRKIKAHPNLSSE